MTRLLWWGNLALAAATLLALASPYVDPRALWVPAFAALAFPSLVVAHLLAVVFWALRRSWRVLLSAGALAAGWPATQALVGLHAASPGDPADDRGRALTATVYNLVGGRRLGSPQGYRADGAELACFAEGADLVATVESPRWAPVAEGLRRDLAAGGLGEVYAPSSVAVRLFSRYPLTRGRVVEAYNEVNGAVAAELIVPGGDTLTVVAAHLQSNRVRLDAGEVVRDLAGGREGEAYWTVRSVAANYRYAARARSEAVAAIADLVRASRHPVLLLGDLNDVPLSYPLGELRRAGLVDAFAEAGRGLGVTYPGTIPGLRIDYVLATPQLRPLSAEVVRDCELSDHRPTRATFAW